MPEVETKFHATTHNGIITIHDPVTNFWWTVKIKTQKADASFAPSERIVSLFTGTDNQCWSHYTGFAFVKEGGLRLWGKFKNNEKYIAVGKMVARPQDYPHLEYKFEGKCRVCNRPLTNPESIDSGIGPECSGKKRKQKGEA